VGAGSKVQLRGNPGSNDDETYVTGHALWVLLAGMVSSSTFINVKVVASDVDGLPNILSGGTGDGRPIALNNATFTTLHTVPAGSRDHVRLYLTNTSAVDVVVTLRLGGTASSDELRVFSPANETVPALDDHMLGPGLVVDAKMAAGSAATVNAFGGVSRFTP